MVIFLFVYIVHKIETKRLVFVFKMLVIKIKTSYHVAKGYFNIK